MRVLTTCLDVAAILLVSAGAWLIYEPAGLVVAGLLVGLVSWRLAR